MNTPTTKFEKWLKSVNDKLRPIHEAQFENLPYEELTYSKGKKYIKILAKRSVWGFVAMQDDPKKNQKIGDLLKAASWNAPAKHSRGNIFDGTASYGPYGPNYLK
jgi:hypothetical protein